MLQSKLLDIIKAIAPEDRKPFQDFLDSPYFNKREDVARLGHYMMEVARQGYPVKKLKIEICWKSIMPGKPYDKKLMAYLMSWLSQLCEDFLGQRQLEQNAGLQSLLAMEALAQARLDKHFQSRLKQYEERSDGSSTFADEHWEAFKLAQIQALHRSQQNVREANTHLPQQNAALDAYFNLQKVKLFCEMLNEQRVLGVRHDFSWPQNSMQAESFQNASPILQVYLQLLSLLQLEEPNEAAFQQYTSLLRQHGSAILPDERAILYHHAINYCLGAINKGDRSYAQHLLALYEEALPAGFLLVNGELSPWIYKNVVKLALGLERFAWAEEFIQQYSASLPQGQHQDAQYYNLADLHYHQKHFQLAMECLNKVEFSDASYKYGAKIMLLKIYYETGADEAFHALAASLRVLLLRDRQLPSDLKSNYKNFIRIVLKIRQVSLSPNASPEPLRRELQRTKNVNDRSWLAAQLLKI